MLANQTEQLLGVQLAGKRPETGAGAAGKNNRLDAHDGL
jgi:hypothetical protein